MVNYRNQQNMKRILFAVALLSVTACQKEKENSTPATALPVTVSLPIVKEITLTRDYPGYLAADATIPVR